MQKRKPRPPVWQQGASRSYIEDPNAEIPDSNEPVSRRSFLILRCIQAAILVVCLIALAGMERHPDGRSSWLPLLVQAAIFIDFRLFSRIHAQPTPTRAEKTRSLVSLGVVIAWAILQVLLVLRVFGTPSAADAWLLGAGLGIVVVPAFVFTAQRARYFRWKATA
ncbi:hypothetical protein [Frondihabitans peucedani]|uniref:hypothetical protein n=1 Tax=Frondihabitans peucedani TaxID=598626 RepID=UPI0031DA549E